MDIWFGILTCSARDESDLRRAMSEDSDLKAKLARLEALFRRAGSPGEKPAGGAAIERLQGRLAGSGEKREPEVELRYSLPDVWSAELFCAVCRKHGVRTYSYRRQRRTTVMVRVREREFDLGAWQEYRRLHDELADCFNDVTDHLISRVMGSGGGSSAPLELEGGRGWTMTDDLKTDRIDEAVLALLSQHLRAFALWRSECVEILEPGCDGQA